MSDYVLTFSAEADLLEIWNFIARDNIEAANRTEARLFSAMDKLARDPNLGHRREDLTEAPYQFFKVGAYLVIYDGEPKPLRIMRVIHGARDLPHLIDDREA